MNKEIIVVGSAPVFEQDIFHRNAEFRFVNLSFKQVKGIMPFTYELFVSKYLIKPSGNLSRKSKQILDDSKLNYTQIGYKINSTCMIWIIRNIGLKYFVKIYKQSKNELYRELKRWIKFNPSISTGFKIILWSLNSVHHDDQIICYGFSLDELSNYSWFNEQCERGHVIQDKIVFDALLDERVVFY